MRTLTGVFRKNMIMTKDFSRVILWDQETDSYQLTSKTETTISNTVDNLDADTLVVQHYDPSNAVYVVNLSGTDPENNYTTTLKQVFLDMNTLHDVPVLLKN